MTFRLGACVWLGVGLLAAPMPAAAQGACAALNRIAAAAREPQPFASLRRALAAGEAVLPGFPARACATTATNFHCAGRDIAASHFADWPRTLTCPGLRSATPAPRPWARNDAWLRAYTLPGLRIEYGGNCLPCRGGAYGFFSARLEASGPGG